MSFLDEVDSLKAKTGLSKPRLALVVGLAVLVCVLVAASAYSLWNVFTSPGLELDQVEASDDAQAEPADGGSEAQGVQEEPAHVFVHVTGAVMSPGVYELSQGARVSDAVEAAGGLKEGAVDSAINLAREVTDGEQIVVPDAASLEAAVQPSGSFDAAGSAHAGASGSTGASSGLVNINTATEEELMTLDGVGEATAQKIISYRQEQGPFKTIEQIKEVSGIGDKKFEAIKDHITV